MSDYYDHVEARYEKLRRHADTWTPRTPTRTAAQEEQLRLRAAHDVSRLGLATPAAPVTPTGTTPTL